MMFDLLIHHKKTIPPVLNAILFLRDFGRDFFVANVTVTDYGYRNISMGDFMNTSDLKALQREILLGFWKAISFTMPPKAH
ncbi:hypothetical protein [Desulfobacterium sp. N47]|uniref:Uncharacterized protein n=1 Tax=uncultured Desulfobacterium sp. TaxID=201089 RepID=E1YJ73_9BACT|nr:unknown protein [uncultured Desulfobacterium sp.]